MPITPAVTLTFTLVDTANNPIKGKVVLTLDNFTGIPRIPATNVIAKLVYTAFADSSGQGSVTFWGNYQTNQPNSFYQISVYPVDSQGHVSNAPSSTNNYRFNTGGTFDLDSLTPINSNPQPVVVPQGQPVLLNPTGTQSIAVFGLEAPWFGSQSTNIADSGIIRLSNSDAIDFRNGANSGDLSLGVNSNDQLVFNGTILNLNLAKQIELSQFVTGSRTGKFWVKGASVSSGTSTVTIGGLGLTYTLDSSDIGKNFVLDGPNGNPVLTGTITGVTNSTTCTISVTSSYNAFGTNFAIYPSSQNDDAAWDSATAELVGGKGKLHAAGDLYVLTTPKTISQAMTSLTGDGIAATMFLYTGTGSCFTVGAGGIWPGQTQPDNINPVPGLTFGGSGSEGFTIQGSRQHAPSVITAVAVASNVATFTCNNTFQVGDIIAPNGMTSTPGVTLRANVYTVASLIGSGPTYTGFTAATNPHPPTPDASTTADTGLCVRFWNGINILSNGSDWLSVDNVEIHGFDGMGFSACDNIVTSMNKVIVWNCYGNGFNLVHGSPFDSGTANTFTACWAKGCGMAGWYTNFCFYYTFNSCASDQNGVNWFFQNCEQFTLNSPGCETPTISASAAYPGYGYLFDSTAGMVINAPYFFGQDFSTTRGDEITLAMSASQTGLVFRNNCNQFILNIPNYENAVNFTPPNFLWDIDNTCTDAIVMYPRFGTLNPATAFTMPNSGANNVTLMRDAAFSSNWAFNGTTTMNSFLTTNSTVTHNGIVNVNAMQTNTAELLVTNTGQLVVGGSSIFNGGATVNGATSGSGRLHCGLVNPDQDTNALTTGMVTFSGGWGSGAAIGFVAGNRPLFAFSIQAGTGASPLPTVTIDMTSWGFSFNPYPIHSSRGNIGVASADWSLVTISSTSVTWQFNGTPTAGAAFGLSVWLLSQETT